jgi:fermentation-respiration switch protein FrsA (DUF1100 family)
MRKPLRILCLHGYHGSADILRGQMSALVDRLPPLVEFVCIDAPSLARRDFGWWHAVNGHYHGWPATRNWAISLFGAQRFDGVFGFSQGAALAALLVGMRAPAGAADPRQALAFDFAMMVGGFVSNDPTHAQLYDPEGFDLPSLHVFGRSDGIVPSSLSQTLASRFKNPRVVEHAGGHVIASDPQTSRQVGAFLEAMAASAA